MSHGQSPAVSTCAECVVRGPVLVSKSGGAAYLRQREGRSLMEGPVVDQGAVPTGL